jgi:hypothetical protein
MSEIRPSYYKLSNGAELIDLIDQKTFCVGNAIKYLIRAGLKGDRLEDLEKALYYVQREIAIEKRVRSIEEVHG